MLARPRAPNRVVHISTMREERSEQASRSPFSWLPIEKIKLPSVGSRISYTINRPFCQWVYTGGKIVVKLGLRYTVDNLKTPNEQSKNPILPQN